MQHNTRFPWPTACAALTYVVCQIALSSTDRANAADEPPRPFAITVVDDVTGRGVPLVELRTVNELRFVTDSAGVAAFHEPGLMNQPVFFYVSSHGYEFPADGFGIRGTRLTTTAGGAATIRIKRLNIAERLYRVTGGGIYADSLLVGKPTPLDQPVLNAQVLGSDSVVCALHQGRLHWFWGDTNLPHYPLGLFHVPGATSLLPKDGGLDPALGVRLEYYRDEQGRARNTAQLPGDGPTWLTGVTVVPDVEGHDRLVTAYMKVKPPLTVYERGWAEFDDTKHEFRKLATFPIDAVRQPFGHPVRHRVDGVDYIYFGDPYLWTRVRATREAWLDLDQYEAFTAVRDDSSPNDPQLDRDDQGQLRFRWRKEGVPWSAELQDKLTKQKLLSEAEPWIDLRDVDTSRRVGVHRGSINWNPFRQCWIMIAVEQGGSSSHLGEVWYAESLAIEGPWRRGKKIMTHDRYSFYNPKHHAFFDQENGRVIYFEGTYTNSFSGRKDATPRYEYNQMMYRLDLSDPRLLSVRAEAGK